MESDDHITKPERASQAWLEGFNHAILDSALDCIITMDADGRVVEFNPAAERVFGYTRAEAVGRELAELIIPPSLREAAPRGPAALFEDRRRPSPRTPNRDRVSALMAPKFSSSWQSPRFASRGCHCSPPICATSPIASKKSGDALRNMPSPVCSPVPGLSPKPGRR